MDIKIRSEAIADILKRRMETYSPEIAIEEVGEVIEAGDGTARVSGIPNVMAMEMVAFSHDIYGIALDLDINEVGVMIQEGTEVKRTGRLLSVPVGEALVGRVVNSLGQPIDGKGPITTDKYRYIEGHAPSVIERQPVKEPLQTGLKCIDAMIPIGRGQRELIIGDRQTGKTA